MIWYHMKGSVSVFILSLNPPGEPQGWRGKKEKPAKSSDPTEHLQWWGLDRLLLVAFFATFFLSSPIPLLILSSGICHPFPVRWDWTRCNNYLLAQSLKIATAHLQQLLTLQIVQVAFCMLTGAEVYIFLLFSSGLGSRTTKESRRRIPEFSYSL